MSKYRNIYLTGFRACGKTTLAKIISSSYGLAFLDTDQRLQQECGLSIEDIVDRYGWEYFRHMEEKVLADTTHSKGLVVATGGGIILREFNRCILKDDKHLTVYLKADPLLIVGRLKADPNPGQRPPLSSFSMEEEIKNNLAQRERLYQECADLILEAHQSTQRLAAGVMKFFTTSLK